MRTDVQKHVTKRPSMVMLAAVWTGLLLAPRLPLSDCVVLALGGVLCAALSLAAGRSASIPLLAAGLFLAGLMRSPPHTSPSCCQDRSVWVGGAGVPVVLRVRLPFLIGQCGDDVRARVEAVLAGYRSLRGTHVILRGMDPEGRRGQRRMTIAGTFQAPQPARNPMAYDLRETYVRARIAGSVRVDGVLDEECEPPDRALARMRLGVRRLIEAVPEAGSRGVLEATLLGRRSGLSPEVESIMVKAGTYHVLAISGLHVGILVFVISMLATVMRLGRVGRVVVSLVLALSFVLFTGARPSAMRAGALLLAVSLARLLQWKTDYPNGVDAIKPRMELS